MYATYSFACSTSTLENYKKLQLGQPNSEPSVKGEDLLSKKQNSQILDHNVVNAIWYEVNSHMQSKCTVRGNNLSNDFFLFYRAPICVQHIIVSFMIYYCHKVNACTNVIGLLKQSNRKQLCILTYQNPHIKLQAFA